MQVLDIEGKVIKGFTLDLYSDFTLDFTLNGVCVLRIDQIHSKHKKIAHLN